MQKEIKLDGQLLKYKLVSHRGYKNVKISISKEGLLMVSKPKYLSIIFVNNFIKRKKDWILSRLSNVVSCNLADNRLDYLNNREKAYSLVCDRLEIINSYYKFKYNKVSVRSAKTRWGSCSSKSNLNFNYKIINLPLHLVDYIVAHELCHLKEMNHSTNFWKLLSLYLPNYKELRKELKSIKC